MLQHITSYPKRFEENTSHFDQTFNVSVAPRPTFSGKLVEQLASQKKKTFATRSVSPEPLAMTDWKTSKLRDRLRRGVPQFNYSNSPILLREDEIDYLINMIRHNR